MESKDQLKTGKAIWTYKYSSLLDTGHLMKKGKTVALVEKQFGEQMVKALNTHDELVKALQTILSNFKANQNFGTTPNKQEVQSGINIIKEALKKATE